MGVADAAICHVRYIRRFRCRIGPNFLPFRKEPTMSKKSILVVSLITIALLCCLTTPRSAVSNTPYPNCRFGVGLVGRNITDYDTGTLNAGWYLDWTTAKTPLRPHGIEYMQVIRLKQTGPTYTYTPSGSTLNAIIAANPGAIWFIGNEMDRRTYQDEMLPEIYAQAYHDIYHLLKGQDPTCLVGVGGIVQPTPLRLEYLDKVLNTYSALYRVPLPTDIWNVHSFILRERDESLPDSWGAGIPPGSTALDGMLYNLRDFDNMDIFRQRIVDFRQWMKGRGQQDKPLFVSEYGILLPSEYFDEDERYFDHERVKAFLYNTFGYFLNATDPSSGYPYDDNRLVQRWLWYSLNDTGYGGDLFDPTTKVIQALGQDYGSYTSALTPFVDLQTVEVFSDPPAPFSTGEAVTLTLKALVSNVGNIAIPDGQAIGVSFYDADSNTQIGAAQITGGLSGCAGLATAQVTWTEVASGLHNVRVRVDPDNSIAESNEGNNDKTGSVLVATTRTLLPIISKETH